MGDRAPGPRDVGSLHPTSIHRGVADRLFSESRITKAQHEAATTLQKRNNIRIEEALLATDAISEPELLKYLASIHKTRFVSTEKLGKADIDRATLDRVPKKLVERLNIVPVLFDAQSSILSIVTADPQNVDAIDQVQKGAGVREVKALIARPAAIQAAIAKYYRGEPFAFAGLEGKAKPDSGTIDLGPGYASGGGSFQSSAPRTQAPSPDFSLGGPTLGGPPPRMPPGAESKRSISLPPIAVPEESGATSDLFLETLNVLITLIENSRQELRGHSAQVARLTRKMCERIGLPRAEHNAIVVAAYLHDLGKMSAYHLTALNTSQYEAPRAAAEKSYATPTRLMSSAKLAPATVLALEGMYERHDGGGFPKQASAKEISLGARLIAITDTYIDLTENPQNPFRKKLSATEACEVLTKYKGTVFDPHLVDLFRSTVAGDDLKARILSNRHVALLLDPDPEETTVLELRMIEEGFEVRIARTVSQARGLLEKGGIEIVVSELDLATEWGATGLESADDGLALLGDARGNRWGAELPWLILTRRQGRDDARRAFELGVIDYVIKPAVTEVLVAKMKKALEQRATATPAHGVSGSLAEMSIPDLVQILWHGRKSGALRIRRGADGGEIHFVEGKVVNAVWGKLRGDEAFYAMLAISQGEFGLDPNFKPTEVLINESPESLLLEGMRRLDES